MESLSRESGRDNPFGRWMGAFSRGSDGVEVGELRESGTVEDGEYPQSPPTVRLQSWHLLSAQCSVLRVPTKLP